MVSSCLLDYTDIEHFHHATSSVDGTILRPCRDSDSVSSIMLPGYITILSSYSSFPEKKRGKKDKSDVVTDATA